MIVDLNKRKHQDNLKAYFIHRFILRFGGSGLRVLCEYRVDRCVFDLIVYESENRNAICIIEVRSFNTKKEVNTGTKKHIKYSKYNVNVLYLSQLSHIEILLDECAKLYDEFLSNGEIKFVTPATEPKPRKTKRKYI